ncbi:hypothetical protein C0J52_03714 [Blattella germanica]|nr:hypothetical protein C0J52_03714 [Blattella germanica]
MSEMETKELCARFTTDVVATCAFGIQGNAIKDPDSEFRLEHFFRRIVEEVVTYRENNNVTRADYIQHLIMLKHKGITNETNGYATLDKNDSWTQVAAELFTFILFTVFTDVDVAAQAITFFGDGFETSSGALSFALYALAVNPDVQIKAREEVVSVLNKYGGKLTFDGVQDMKYLDMVLSESLRMYTPVTFMVRVCTKPFKLETPSGSNYTTEVGTPAIIPVYAIHYDPKLYPNPQHFDPERFSEENKKNRHKYIHLPFGFRFALMQMEIPIIGSWWALALLLLGWLLYLYLTWNHDYWKKRGVPFVKPIPLFGNFMDAMKLDGHKYGGMFRMGQPVLVVRDPDIVKTVLLKDFNSFHDNDIDSDVNTDPLFGRNPFVLKGESWKIVRGMITPALTTGKIKPYFPLITEVCKDFTEMIKKSGTVQFEAKEICSRFTTDVVATCGYGIKGNALQDPNCEFRQMVSTIQDISAQASTFFVDGYETSSGVLAFSLYCLAIYPDVQARLRREVDSNIKKHNGEITYEGIQEMQYLEMVFSEVLRVYPPGTVLSKRCTKDFNLETPSGGVYVVESGTPVAIPLYAIHHDPKYFPDPERFDPERFSEENKNNIQKYTYFPFGDGPRICLGRRFAITQVKAGIASIIHNFELRPNKKTKIPIVQDPHYFILACKGGLWMDIVELSDKYFQ